MRDVTLYVKCNHLIFAHDVKKGESYSLDTEYDWCPKCTEEILKKQEELQMKFKETFGDSKHDKPSGLK